MKKYLILVCLVVLYFAGHAQTNNTELQHMADTDQQARNTANINWKLLNKQDSTRREQVLKLIQAGKVTTAVDHLNAGIIFQHGNDTIASAMAVKSFQRAVELDSTLNRWWYAAAVDRDLMRRGLPQIYGTQFIQTKDGKWMRYQIDPSKITDQQRKYYSVETLDEQAKKERLMNLKPISAHYAETKNIKLTLAQMKGQFYKGTLSTFNVSEDAINSFGYELMAKGLSQDAMKILALNTKLYPKSANTFDSYGEVLLKLGKRKQALEAYKKSVKLNPQNTNAKEILQKNN